MTRLAGLIALVIWAVGAAPNASAAFIVYTAALSGPAESPPNASPGTGSARVTIDTVANTMRVQVSFQGLLGTTTASHIHAATAVPLAGTAIVATTTPTFPGFPLGVTAGSYDQTFDLGVASTYNAAFITANGGTTASAETALLAALADGKAYLNVHSSVFPGGEIRGFLTPAVPAPAGLVLAAVGAPALGLIRRRRTAV